MFGVAAFALTLNVTDPPGPGLDPDGAFYLGGAKSIAGGHGFRAPIALWSSPDTTAPIDHFPPGLSTAIAIPTAAGMPPVQGARLVNALSAFVTLTIAVWLAAAAAGPGTALALGLALLVTPALVADHLDVLSEPLFLACVMLALLAMVRDPERPLGAAVAAAVASLVRYAGLGISGAVVLWAFFQPANLATRVRRATIAALPTLILQGAWVVRARSLGGRKAIRQFAVYTRGFGTDLAQGWTTISNWLVPLDEPQRGIHPRLIAVGAIVVLAAIIAVGAMMARHAAKESIAARVLAASGLLAVCYVGLVVVSRLLADPLIPFDERLISPIMLLTELAVAVAAAAFWRFTADPTRIALLGSLAIWCAAAAGVSGNYVHCALTNGNDLAGDQWRNSSLVDWVRRHARGAPLYSDWPAAVNFYLDRPARDLPFGNTPTNMRAFADTIRARHAVILDFDVQNPEFITQDTLVKVAGLRVLATLDDGKVIVAR